MNGKYNILIVDDEPQIIKSIKRILDSESYSLFSTRLPEEAAEILRQNDIDVIVCDQRMPNISGLELLKYSSRISSGTVRILMTGYSDIDIVISSINDGNIFYYISKPWDNENFKAVIKKAAEYSCEQKENAEKLKAAEKEKGDRFKLFNKMKTQLEKHDQQSISALIEVIKAKDINLYKHSQRVAQYALMIADMMNLDNKQKYKIKYAALFHDIGKISIKDNILDKPCKLDESEYNEIKRHPMVGADIIKEIGNLKEISEIISQHHEHVDGGGYPRGIKGHEIRLEARIISVADTYDALTSERVYRKELNVKTACNILRMGKSTYYDPHIVDIFLGGILNE